MNISKSVKGFDSVLKGLYGGENKNNGKEKLRNASEAAKKIASSIVVLN